MKVKADLQLDSVTVTLFGDEKNEQIVHGVFSKAIASVIMRTENIHVNYYSSWCFISLV